MIPHARDVFTTANFPAPAQAFVCGMHYLCRREAALGITAQASLAILLSFALSL